MEDQKTVFKRLKDQVEKSAYQKDLHFASENEEAIRTHFLNIKRKETWSYRNNVSLDCLGDISNPEFITYKVKNLPYHGLINTVLVQHFPLIIAEPGYEIRWPPNMGSNVIKSATFKINEFEPQTLTSRYFDHHFQKIDTHPSTYRDLGNVSEMQRWNTALPAFDTFLSIPWFFTQHSSKMFPLYKCGKEDEISILVNLRRSIKDFLMVRDADTKEIIPFDEKYIRVSTSMLPVPKIHAEYEFLSDMECEHNRCEDIQSKYNNHIFDIDNVKSIDSDNIHTLNTTVNVKIKDMPFPVHSIHWSAVNLKAEGLNYLSNYTTNSTNHMMGGNPIKWISLSSPTGIIFKNQEFYIGERIVSRHNFNKIPDEPGYGCWTNAPKATDVLYPKPGIKLDDSELTFRLENNDLPTDDSFRINVQVVYTYRITIKDYPKTENERNVKGIEFEISGDF